MLMKMQYSFLFSEGNSKHLSVDFHYLLISLLVCKHVVFPVYSVKEKFAHKKESIPGKFSVTGNTDCDKMVVLKQKFLPGLFL